LKTSVIRLIEIRTLFLAFGAEVYLRVIIKTYVRKRAFEQILESLRNNAVIIICYLKVKRF